jgi:acyl-CoA thioester hydrolase
MGWPRVHAECDYRHPLRFEDEFEVHMLVSRKKSKSLSYIFKFTKLNGHEPIEVARGSLTVVCVIKKKDGSFAATQMPKAFANKIEIAPAKLLK